MVDINKVREGLREIDVAVHTTWKLGKNMVVGWTSDDQGIQVCLSPAYKVLAMAGTNPRLLNGGRHMGLSTFAEVCKILQARPLKISVPFKVGTERGKEVDPEAIDSVIRRYSIVQSKYRAVMLFDVVGFSKVSSVEQVAQLNSLEYSINNASKKLADVGLEVELARSTVGDGFYVWNRSRGLEADLRTYVALILILHDNALARAAAGADSNLVPMLRAAYSIGSHYSYHQVEGTKPRGFEYIVGDVTITLARIIGKALAGQIVIGGFQRPLDPLTQMLDTVMFLVRAEKVLARLQGAIIGEHEIKEVKSMLTGGKVGDRTVPIVKYMIQDKHGYNHEAFNLRATINREDAEPITLGLSPKDVADFEATPAIYEMLAQANDGPRMVNVGG